MLRIDIGTPITTIMQNLKKKYGVEISTHMAYRARKQALKVVQGDQGGQYTRIRDYLQAVLDTNPGQGEELHLLLLHLLLLPGGLPGRMLPQYLLLLQGGLPGRKLPQLVYLLHLL